MSWQPACFGKGHLSPQYCTGCTLKAACAITQYHNARKDDAMNVVISPDTLLLNPELMPSPLTKDTRDTSDGSTADYYVLPEGAAQLQELISFRNMNGQDAEMFRALYRKGHCSHSSKLREAKKVLFYAQAEVARLEKYGEGA